MTGGAADRRPLVVVTGGSRGIGHHLVESFLEEADVLNISRKPAQQAGAGAAHELYDLCLDLEEAETAGARLGAWLDGHPDHDVTVLVHNAAVLNPGRLDQVTAQASLQSWRINVHAPLALTAAVSRLGRFSAQGARVVYVISSLARPVPGLSFAGIGLYSTTKAALSRMALIQGREFELTAPYVKVLRVHPGIVDTELQHELRIDPDMDPAFREKTAGLPPYREGEWDEKAPGEHMRTVSPEFAAQFVVWAAREPEVHSDEYDFYHTPEFHRSRSRQRLGERV